MFTGQVVFITGASSGIGAALAREFAREGADLALAARRIDRLEALADELRTRGRSVLVLPCDVTRDQDLKAAVASTVAELGRIDVVVANAGYGVVGPLERLTLDDYRPSGPWPSPWISSSAPPACRSLWSARAS